MTETTIVCPWLLVQGHDDATCTWRGHKTYADPDPATTYDDHVEKATLGICCHCGTPVVFDYEYEVWKHEWTWKEECNG